MKHQKSFFKKKADNASQSMYNPLGSGGLDCHVVPKAFSVLKKMDPTCSTVTSRSLTKA